MRWYLILLVFLTCSCDTPKIMKQNSKEVIPDLATDEAAWLEKAKEQAHEKSTGTSSMTAPCEAYVQTVPGIPLWPGVRIGGLYSKRDIILPPVDIEEEFKRRLMMHRIEQREYWANKLNKGIMFGVALMVVGVIIKLWAKLSVGARIFFYGAGFACFCIACQWYFDYIPYIAVGFLGFIIFDMAWSVYSDKKSKTVKDELAGTVETVKEKIREKDLGHLWEEVKEDLSHGKSTIEHVKSYKSDVKAVTKKAVAKAVESIK